MATTIERREVPFDQITILEDGQRAPQPAPVNPNPVMHVPDHLQNSSRAAKVAHKVLHKLDKGLGRVSLFFFKPCLSRRQRYIKKARSMTDEQLLYVLFTFLVDLRWLRNFASVGGVLRENENSIDYQNWCKGYLWWRVVQREICTRNITLADDLSRRMPVFNSDFIYPYHWIPF